MFITLKCNKDNISVEQASASTAQGTRPRHAACNHCRLKKLKCDGVRPSCTGCATNNLECIFPPPGRAPNGSAKRGNSSNISRAQSPTTQTGPSSPASRKSATPRLSTSSSTISIDQDGDPLVPAQNHIPEATGAIFDSFWKESPTSLGDLLVEGLGTVFPESGTDLLMDHVNLPSNEDILPLNADDALTVLSSEMFGDPSHNMALPDPTHQYTDPVHVDPNAMFLPPLGEAETISCAEFTGTALSGDNDHTCRCMTDALTTLDKLETQKKFTHTLSGTLSSNKSALLQCTRVLECPSCQYRPGCALLLILICRNLVSEFEKLLTSEFDQNGTQTRPINSLSNNGAALGPYPIDTSEEQVLVLHALAIVQGRQLAGFLEKLRNSVCFHVGATHQEKIEGIENWHRRLMEKLKQMSYECI